MKQKENIIRKENQVFLKKVGAFKKRKYLCSMPRSREDADNAGIPVKEIQHNMKRRFPCHNYSDKGTYMLTLVVEGRKPLFGTLQGDGLAPSDSENEPRVVLSPLGKAILNREIQKIPAFYPMVEVWKLCIMPDHLHIIIRVKEKMPEGKNLGQVVRGFKTGCTRAWWGLTEGEETFGEPKVTGAQATPAAPVPAIPAPVPAGSAPVPAGSAPVPAGSVPVPAGSAPVPAGSAPVPAGSPAGPAGSAPVPAGSAPVSAGSAPVPAGSAPVPAGSAPVPAGSAPVPAGSVPVPAGSVPVPAGSTAGSVPVPAGSAPVPAGSPAGPGLRPLLFEKGYCDKILLRPGQLDNWKRYLDDNPRRLAIKRQHPDYFTIMHQISIGEWTCKAVGNHFLLNNPEKAAVIVHSAYNDAQFAEMKAKWLALAENGGVLISAAIATREKEVMREAMDCGYRLIYLRENGFPEFYKPAGESFTACSEGRLLQISPWDYHMQRKTISR